MKVAVIGADGQLGTDVVAALAAHDVVGYVEPTREGAAKLDVTDAQSVAQALAADSPDWVINTAAMTDVEGCESNVFAAVNVNAIGARNVAAACARIGATLVHISTGYVFDGKKTGAYIEADLPAPLSVYGMTKLMGEWYVQSECPLHYIVRTNGLYGHTPAVGKGGANFVETMLRLAGERDELTIVNDEVLTPTFSGDLAQQIRVIVERAPTPGLYHATNGGSCSWFEFAREVFRLGGVDVKTRPISSREWKAAARRPANSVLANEVLAAHDCYVMPEWRDALSRYMAGRPSGDSARR